MPNRLPTGNIPTPAVRKSPGAMPSPKPQIKVVLPHGNRVGIKDLGKNSGTPTPKPMPKEKSNAEYFAAQKAYIASQKKGK